MGRKPKDENAINAKDNKNMVRDRVGEKTDLSLCPLCTAYTDCFGNIEGRCTALGKVDESAPCSFYRNGDENLTEAKKCFQRLKDQGRSDLIHKYIKPLSTMGMLDDEIEEAEDFGTQFDSFRDADYQEQFDKALEGGLFDDDLLDADDVDADDADPDETDEDEIDEEDDDAAGDDPWDDGRA